ncbi:MAG: endonuclease/exonuclease/phosphatase family protein [Alistipes sp.]|nr:endonuclease/exonuclease/phosphatase family protein [Alistipes sp.]
MKKIFFALVAAAAMFSVACNKTSEIEVMSYNIRYLNNKDGENHWDNRKHASINMIREEQPTVFGTQEGVWEQMSYFVENLPEYGHIGIGQDDGKLEGEIMSIFYHKDKVELLDGGIFWLSETPDTPSIGWGASQHRSCTWTKMRDKKSGKEFFYLNTHLDHRSWWARAESVKLILTRVEELTAGSNIPVFITADWNAVSTHAIFAPMQDVMLDAREVAPVTDRRATYNAWQKGGEDDAKRVIDHIFFRNAEAEKFEVLMDKDYGWELISDHYPVVLTATF